MLESWGCGLYTSAAYTRVFTVMKIIITTIITQWNVNIMKDYGTGKICLLYGVCYIEVPP